MPLFVYIISAVLVFIFSGVLAMAGLGAAFLFVPLFYYLGVPLAEATPTALLLNVISLLFATINYWRGKLINWRVGLPVLVMAVILSPLGARLTTSVDKKILLAMFAAFLVFAGAMMLFYQAEKRDQALSRPAGKGNIRKLGYGKFVLTLIDNKTGRSVRVATRNEVIKRNQESEFIQFRKKGVPASKIAPELIEPAVDFILAEPTEKLFNIGPVQEVKVTPGRAHDFNTFICSECGEVAVERYARVKNGEVVCMPCAEKA